MVWCGVRSGEENLWTRAVTRGAAKGGEKSVKLGSSIGSFFSVFTVHFTSRGGIHTAGCAAHNMPPGGSIIPGWPRPAISPRRRTCLRNFQQLICASAENASITQWDKFSSSTREAEGTETMSRERERGGRKKDARSGRRFSVESEQPAEGFEAKSHLELPLY